jgi:osmoprotectant transport system substrate-binding protein
VGAWFAGAALSFEEQRRRARAYRLRLMSRRDNYPRHAARIRRNLVLSALYVGLVLFLLIVSLVWESVGAETIVLALLLFLPVILPRIRALSFPVFGGQASVELLPQRIEIQEEKVARLSNQTDLLLSSLTAQVLAPELREERDTLIIGCQRGVEQMVLGALMKQLFHAQLDLDEHKVVAGYDYGGAALNFLSLFRGKTDISPAYTWQGFEMSLGPSLQFSADRLRKLSVEETIEELGHLYEKSGLRWLHYLSFSSNWELVMLAEKASALAIDRAEQLPVESMRLTLGCPREFFARDAAYGALTREGNEFKKETFLEGEGLYDALIEGEVDVIAGFSTDARLDSPAVRVLKGTSELFGQNFAVPIARVETLSKYPAMPDAVKRLGEAIDGTGRQGREEIRALVRRAQGRGGTPEAVERVAEGFLRNKGLA